ncbi:synaptic vesicle 2-related protein-like isoform X2 [Corticium candelabrum]|uniref:synaptic vesicle 2-related protein-like isoform X2 n=1 Tax=Corticium candelabrum TaxID=121492 RepID=UPI002E25ECA4|nr:synaptic vesicle 2-related protein-like isoform X2 [Corticium candelabrum]
MAAVQFRKLDENEDDREEIEVSMSDHTFTVDDAIEQCGFGLFQIWLSIFSGLIWVVFIGMLIGSTLWGKILDKWGRKRGLFLSTIWVCYFALLSAFAYSYVWLLVLRALVGFGIAASPQAMTYYAEFLPVKSRAYCLIFVEVFFSIGTMLEVVLAIIVMPRFDWHWLLGLTAIPVFIDLFAFKLVPESPRYYVAAGQLEKAREVLEQVARMNGKTLPAGRLVSHKGKQNIDASVVSESESTLETHAEYHSTDRHTVTKVDDSKVKSSDVDDRPVVTKVDGSGVEPSYVDEGSDLLTSKSSDGNGKVSQNERGSFSLLFSSKKMGKSTILLWVIWFSMAFTYYGIVLLTTEMLAIIKERSNDSSVVPCIEEAPVDNDNCARLEQDDYLTLLWTTAAEAPGLIITALIIERIGRKKTMALELAGCAVMFLLMLICPIRTALLMLLVFLTRALITGGYQAAFVYTPEVFPTNVRGLGLGSCSGAARLGAIATPFIAQVVLRASISSAKGTYAAVGLLCSICALLLPIETRGRLMTEQVDSL